LFFTVLEKKGESMLLAIALLDERAVKELRKKGYTAFYAQVSLHDHEWLEEALTQKVNEAKEGDSSFSLFVNVDPDGCVDFLYKGNYLDFETIISCLESNFSVCYDVENDSEEILEDREFDEEDLFEDGDLDEDCEF